MSLCSSSEFKFSTIFALSYFMYLSFSTIFSNDLCVLSRSSLFSTVSKSPQTSPDCSKTLQQNTIQGESIPLLRHQNCGCCGEVAFLHSLFWSNDCNFHPRITCYLQYESFWIRTFWKIPLPPRLGFKIPKINLGMFVFQPLPQNWEFLPNSCVLCLPLIRINLCLLQKKKIVFIYQIPPFSKAW